MGTPVTIIYTREEEKKHSVRFTQKEAKNADGNIIAEPVLGKIYVGRKGTYLANAQKLEVTIREIE